MFISPAFDDLRLQTSWFVRLVVCGGNCESNLTQIIKIWRFCEKQMTASWLIHFFSLKKQGEGENKTSWESADGRSADDPNPCGGKIMIVKIFSQRKSALPDSNCRSFCVEIKGTKKDLDEK